MAAHVAPVRRSRRWVAVGFDDLGVCNMILTMILKQLDEMMEWDSTIQVG